MKKHIAILIIITGILTVACNKLKITKGADINIAGKGNYSIRDMAVVSGNRGPISIKGENSNAEECEYITGSYSSNDSTIRCLTAKYTEQGKTVWFRIYPDQSVEGTKPSWSIGLSLLANTDGGLKELYIYVLAKEYAGDHQEQLILLKYDSLGNRLFNKTMARSNDWLDASLISDNKGNLYCTGYSLNKKADSITEIFLSKYNPSGEQIWSKSYKNLETHCRYIRFQLRYPDQLVCAGIMEDRRDVFFIDFDSLGSAQDMVVCSSPEQEVSLADIKIDENRSVYFISNYFIDHSGMDFSTVVYDRMNTMRWRTVFKDSAGDDDQAHAMAIDDSGCVYVAGKRKDQQGSNYLVLVKYDTTGTELWRRTDVLIPGAPHGRWFIDPDFINNRFEYRPASDMDVIGGTLNGVFIARYNTVGSKKAFAQYRIKDQTSMVGAVEDRLIVVNLLTEKKSRAILLKYEDFEILGINRWD